MCEYESENTSNLINTSMSSSDGERRTEELVELHLTFGTANGSLAGINARPPARLQCN